MYLNYVMFWLIYMSNVFSPDFSAKDSHQLLMVLEDSSQSYHPKWERKPMHQVMYQSSVESVETMVLYTLRHVSMKRQNRYFITAGACLNGQLQRITSTANHWSNAKNVSFIQPLSARYDLCTFWFLPIEGWARVGGWWDQQLCQTWWKWHYSGLATTLRSYSIFSNPFLPFPFLIRHAWYGNNSR